MMQNNFADCFPTQNNLQNCFTNNCKTVLQAICKTVLQTICKVGTGSVQWDFSGEIARTYLKKQQVVRFLGILCSRLILHDFPLN